MSTPKHPPVPAQIKACCQALDDKKATALLVLFLGEKSSIADYFVIATGMSEPHLKALDKAARDALETKGATVRGRGGDIKSGWLVVDACDIIIHLFTPAMRERYRIEALWKDAAQIPVKHLLEP